MKLQGRLTIASMLTTLAVTAVYAQDKYSLKSPDGVAFSDFRGYEDWSVVSSARTDEVLKVIVANPAMIEAFKAGIPGNGQPFPEGAKIAKLQWKPKKSTEAPFAVDVPDVFTQAFVMEKDSQRFPKSGGWGYALFNYDAASASFAAPGYAEVYSTGDPDDAAVAILKMLAKDRQVQSLTASAAAEAMVFTVEQHFARLFEIYERIVAERSTR